MALFSKALAKTKEGIFGRLFGLFKTKHLTEELLEEIEELLILADVGIAATEKIIERVRETKEPKKGIVEALNEILKEGEVKITTKPFVVSVVGVNGTGKTSTCGKLAKMFIENGMEVVMAASDTFRAAAIEQLKEWGKKVGATVIAHTEGADPAAVAHDAVVHAKAKSKDVVIIDTAGRLHNKRHLMEELRKIHRVVERGIDGAPHEVLLVIDATTGQNGLIQAKVFKQLVDVTGIVLTKLDGTAKGGIVVAIADELGIPIKFVGIGEGVGDLKRFDKREFISSLLEEPT